MAKPIETTVYHIVLPYAQQMGLEIVDVEYLSHKDRDNELTIYIDRPGGVDIDTCEALSRAIDEPIDAADPIADSYVLCVSSPGLDRPLKKDKDLARAINCEVDIKLYKKRDGKKEYTGALKQFDDKTLTILEKNRQIVFERTDIALIRLHISF